MIAWLFVAAALAADPAVVSLSEALEMSEEGNSQNGIASWRLVGARASMNGVAANFLPKVTAQATVLRWDQELLLDLGAGATLPPPFDTLLAPTVIREQVTMTAGITAVQPLTGLYAISEGLAAKRHLARAAEADAEATTFDVYGQVVDAYFQTLETEQLAQVLGRARESLEGHVKRARAFHRTGLLLKSDLLQLEVALANARLSEQRVLDGIDLGRRRLAMVTGADTELAPAPIPPGEPPGIEVTADAAVQRAITHRPEAVAINESLLAARAGQRASRADLAPQVAAIASWQLTEGQGSFAAPNAWYVGMSAQWQLFGGGQKHFAVREATAGVHQAEEGKRALTDGIDLEIRAVLLAVASARRAYDASGTIVEQAEENLRLVSARFERQLVGSNELLDAETLLAQARAGRVSSWYDLLIAVADAQRALHLPIDPLAGIQETL